MNARRIFFSSAGTLRAPWRIGFFGLATTAGVIAAIPLVGPAIAWIYRLVGLRGMTTEWWVQLAGVLAATVLCVYWLDKRSAAAVWMDKQAARPALQNAAE